MNPEQKIFNDIRRLLIELYDERQVWTYNPPASAKYPFIRIGEVFRQRIRLHKDDLNGDMQVTIHFWHDSTRERGTLINMMADVEDALIGLFGVRGEDVTTRMLEDNSTAVTLLHGVLEINIKRYKGEI